MPHRTTWRLLVAVVSLLALTAPDADAVARPLDHRVSVADPSVTRTRPGQYVAVATGQRLVRLVSGNGRRWRQIGPALAHRPRWARAGGKIWAADLVHLRGRWLLYYAAPVRGMGPNSRCIGVAASRTSTGRFRPVGGRPLVCPPRARVPRAEDRIVDRGHARPTYPTTGAIDPSVFLDRGRVLLLYKTDGKPSSIRVVRLRADGRHVRGRSRALLSARGVVENPVMMRRGRWIYLFVSTGDYSTCSYSTAWRRSRSVYRWRGRAQHVLLARRSTGLCGPGGADVVADRRTVRLYFHAWTCRGGSRPCAEPFHSLHGRERARRPVRSLYGARLRFTPRHTVRVAAFLHPTVLARSKARAAKVRARTRHAARVRHLEHVRHLKHVRHLERLEQQAAKKKRARRHHPHRRS